MCNHYRLKNTERIIDEAARWDDDYTSIPDDIVTFADSPIPGETWPWKDNALLPVVFSHEMSGKLGFMRWGVWPWWEKQQPKTFANTCNARDDRLLASAAWKQSVAKRRCLIPADGFFEWAGPKGAKWKVLFSLPEDEVFYFAGVWSRDPSGGGNGFAIVTTAPNETVAALPHDRMPVLFANRAEAVGWLGSEPLPPERIAELCRPFRGELIRFDQPRPDPTKGKVTRENLEQSSSDLPLS